MFVVTKQKDIKYIIETFNFFVQNIINAFYIIAIETSVILDLQLKDSVFQIDFKPNLQNLNI